MPRVTQYSHGPYPAPLLYWTVVVWNAWLLGCSCCKIYADVRANSLLVNDVIRRIADARCNGEGVEVQVSCVLRWRQVLGFGLLVAVAAQIAAQAHQRYAQR